jgi:hypothetical protein
MENFCHFQKQFIEAMILKRDRVNRLYSIKFLLSNKHIAQYAYLIFLKEQRSVNDRQENNQHGAASSMSCGRAMSTMTDSDGKMSRAFSSAALGNHFYRAFSSAASRPMTTEDDQSEGGDNSSDENKKEAEKSRRAHSVNKNKSTPVLDAYEFEGSRAFDHLF